MNGAAHPVLRRQIVAGTALLCRSGAGPGMPVVLLHGIGSRADSWEPLLARLAPRFAAIAWDAPGYGDSVPLAEAMPRPSDYAARLAAVLDALHLDRVLLVGHSLGALFAASFAASRPGCVAGLALLSPAGGYRVAPGAALPQPAQERIDELKRLGSETFAATRAPRLVYRPEQTPMVLEAVRRSMATIRPAGYAQAVRALGAGDLAGDAARITAPALVAVGVEDVITPPAGARAAFSALRHGWRFEEVPGAGHALPQEAPGIVADLLAGLADHVSPTA